MPTLEEFLSHPIDTLEHALHIRKQIAALEEGLKELFGPTPISLAGVQTAVPPRRGQRKMSAAAKAKIANAQRLRWAKSKGLESATLAGPGAPSPATEPKKKGGMSAAGRARVAAAQKARWAAVKSQKATSAPAKAAPKKKRQLSPEARARIVAAVKARWARAKKA